MGAGERALVLELSTATLGSGGTVRSRTKAACALSIYRQPAGDRTADGRDIPWAIEKGWVVMMAASDMNAHLGI